MKRLTTRQRMERMVNGYVLQTLHPVFKRVIPADRATALLLAEHLRLRAKVRKLHQRYTTGIYGDSPVDYFVEDLLKAMK